MNNKLTVSFALLAGLAGGMLTRFIAPAPVFAQTPFRCSAPAPAPMHAGLSRKKFARESFTLVDQYGNVVGTFASEPSGRGKNFPPGDGSTPRCKCKGARTHYAARLLWARNLERGRQRHPAADVDYALRYATMTASCSRNPSCEASLNAS